MAEQMTLEQLCKPIAKSLRRTAQRLTYSLDSEAADDLMQETMLKVYKTLPYSGHDFRQWIFAIMKNAAIDMHNNRKRNEHIDIDDIPVADDTAQSGYHAVYRAEIRRELMAMLECMPKNCQLPFILRDGHGYSYDDICEITGFSLEQVSNRIYRARKKMKGYRK